MSVKESQSKLSVLLTNYNHAKFLREALDSVLNQTCFPDEFIIFDDGSTDNSQKILQEYALKYPVIKLTLFKENQGCNEMSSRLAEAATGEFVHFLASDDFVEKTFYEKSIEQLKKYPKAAFSSTLCRTVNENGKDLGLIKTPMVSLKPAYFRPLEVRSKLQDYGIWQMGCSAVYRREALKSIGSFNREVSRLRSFFDTFAMLLLALKHGCVFIPETLSVFRKLEESFSAKMAKNEETHSDIIDFFKELSETQHKDIIPPEVVNDFARSFWGFHLIDLSDLDERIRLKKLNNVLAGKGVFYKALSKLLDLGICKGRFAQKLLVVLSYDRQILKTIYGKTRTLLFLQFLKLKGSIH
jgi:glycosyltransferase involved in cell wall biosynthesis